MIERIQQLRTLAAEINRVADSLEQSATLPPPRAPAPRAAAPTPSRQGGPLYGGNAPEAEPCAPPFGRQANQPLSQIDRKDLIWYRDAVARSLDDPEKAKWAASNRKRLAELEAEIGRR